MTIQDLLDLSKTIAAPLFAGKTYPWEALAEIGDFILQLGPTLPAEEYEQRGENIWIARDAKIFDSAYIAGPCMSLMAVSSPSPVLAYLPKIMCPDCSPPIRCPLARMFSATYLSPTAVFS